MYFYFSNAKSLITLCFIFILISQHLINCENIIKIIFVFSTFNYVRPLIIVYYYIYISKQTTYFIYMKHLYVTINN
jgi:hypothetical protein